MIKSSKHKDKTVASSLGSYNMAASRKPAEKELPHYTFQDFSRIADCGLSDTLISSPTEDSEHSQLTPSVTRSSTRDIQQQPLWKSDTSIKSKGEISLDLEAATGRDDEDSAYANDLQQHLMEDEQLLASMIQLANLSSRLSILEGSSDDI